MIKLKTYSTTKSLKGNDNKNLNLTLTSSESGKHTTNNVVKCTERCRVCNIIIEGTSYYFEKPKTTFIIIET